MARSSEIRGTDKDRLHVVCFETGTDRASDMKLLRPVRMRLRPYLEWINPYYFCVSSKEENTNFELVWNYFDLKFILYIHIYKTGSANHQVQFWVIRSGSLLERFQVTEGFRSSLIFGPVLWKHSLSQCRFSSCLLSLRFSAVAIVGVKNN